jgi:cysteine desulfurase
MRGGTENVYGIAGLAKALEMAYEHMADHQNHIQGIKDYFIKKLNENIPGVSFNGNSGGESLYTVLNVLFPKTENAEMLLFNLDIAGISASGGSACTSGSNQGSHVLRGIKIDQEKPSIRFSFSKYNTTDEVDFTIDKLTELFKIKNKEIAS